MHRPVLLQHINRHSTLSSRIHQQLQRHLSLSTELVTIRCTFKQHLKVMLHLVTRRQCHQIILTLATDFHWFSIEDRGPQVRIFIWQTKPQRLHTAGLQTHTAATLHSPGITQHADIIHRLAHGARDHTGGIRGFLNLKRVIRLHEAIHQSRSSAAFRRRGCNDRRILSRKPGNLCRQQSLQ